MAKKIESRDYNARIAAIVFAELNKSFVKYEDTLGGMLICEISPDDHRLVYPDGWYPAKGYLRNKHFSSSGLYGEVPLCRPDGSMWSTVAQTPDEMELLTAIIWFNFPLGALTLREVFFFYLFVEKTLKI